MHTAWVALDLESGIRNKAACFCLALTLTLGQRWVLIGSAGNSRSWHANSVHFGIFRGSYVKLEWLLIRSRLYERELWKQGTKSISYWAYTIFTFTFLDIKIAIMISFIGIIFNKTLCMLKILSWTYLNSPRNISFISGFRMPNAFDDVILEKGTFWLVQYSPKWTVWKEPLEIHLSS